MGRERMEYEGTGERLPEEGQRAQQRARQQGEQFKNDLASGLHTAAQRVREQSREMERPGLAMRVADPLDRSAQYLGSHSLPQIRDDISRTAQEHPLWAAAGVFATAFLVGRLLRRR